MCENNQKQPVMEGYYNESRNDAGRSPQLVGDSTRTLDIHQAIPPYVGGASGAPAQGMAGDFDKSILTKPMIDKRNQPVKEISRYSHPRSPMECEMLLKLFYQGSWNEYVQVNTPMHDSLERFFRHGLVNKTLDHNGLHYHGVHAALSLYVDELLAVPFPEHRWVMP